MYAYFQAMFYADQLLTKSSTKTQEAVIRGPSAGEHPFPNRGARFATSPTKRVVGKAF